MPLAFSTFELYVSILIVDNLVSKGLTRSLEKKQKNFSKRKVSSKRWLKHRHYMLRGIKQY